jgi:mRNA interferase RelE/StbE
VVTYNVSIRRQAQKALAALSRDAYDRVRDAIWALADDPRPPGHIKLASREGYRIRIGDYRVIYEIDDSQSSITVLIIGHRRDVYR